MTLRMAVIGTAIMAVAVTTSAVLAGQADDTQTQTPGQTQAQGQVQAPPPAGSPQGRGMGMGRGQGQGRGMGLGPNMDSAGRGLGQGPGGGLRARLDLTDDQQKAIDALHRGLRDQSAPIADELELSRKSLHRGVFADQRDAAKVSTLATKVLTLEKQLLDLRLKNQGAVADVLTPAQRETMRISGGGGGGMGAGPGRGRGAGRGMGAGGGMGPGRGAGMGLGPCGGVNR